LEGFTSTPLHRNFVREVYRSGKGVSVVKEDAIGMCTYRIRLRSGKLLFGKKGKKQQKEQQG